MRELDVFNGRWTSRDPLGFAGGDFNVYVYGYNQPQGLDPSGLDTGTILDPIKIVTGSLSGPISRYIWRCTIINGVRGVCLPFTLTVGLLCLPKAAGPSPRDDKSCEALGNTSPKYGSVYYPPRWPKAYGSIGSTCADAIASAKATVQKRYPGIKLTNKPDPPTDGPCPSIGEHVVLQSKTGGKKATIVCCPTCDDAPETHEAKTGCKCGILDQNHRPWRP